MLRAVQQRRFMLEGRPVAYTREFRSSGGDVEIATREDLPEGEVIFRGHVWSKYSNAQRVSSLHLSKSRLNPPCT